MKKLTFIFLFLATVFVSSAQDKLTLAEKAYDQKKYKDAIEHYESLLKEGFHSYQLYYNLGNCYFRNNDIGKAIYNYELARKIEPNDEDVMINLSKATAKTIDKIDSKENFFISVVKSNVLSSLSTKAWAWISIYLIMAACIFIFLFVSANQKSTKQLFLILSFLFTFSFLISYFLGYSALNSKHNNKFAIITAKEIRIYNEPTITASTKFNLHEGTKVRLVEGNGDWYLIKLDNGNEGWVKLSEIGII